MYVCFWLEYDDDDKRERKKERGIVDPFSHSELLSLLQASGSHIYLKRLKDSEFVDFLIIHRLEKYRSGRNSWTLDGGIR